MLEQDSYLLQNQMNPFPISGRLTLDDQGELSFRLDEKAAQASLGWLEKAMGREGLKESILGGDAPVVFSLPVSGRKISWPKLLGGYAMKFSTRRSHLDRELELPLGRRRLADDQHDQERLDD